MRRCRGRLKFLERELQETSDANRRLGDVRHHFADFTIRKHVGEPIAAQEQAFTFLQRRAFIDVRDDGGPRVSRPPRDCGNPNPG